MYTPQASSLAPLAVSLLIGLLAYGSQALFRYIEPFSLDKQQAIIFNILVGCIWICYGRACLVDPGRVPIEWTPSSSNDVLEYNAADDHHRWCRKCESFKPPRAHHCKTCKRCIPKMDHHCPWTVNCVSHRTFPHFMRFLFYAVMSMTYLQYLLYLRVLVIWDNRDLPSYLGPSPAQMISLLSVILFNSITLFALFVLFVRSLWSLFTNITTIESWEIERHNALLRRARPRGGFLDGPDGTKVRIKKQEFPYDIGILANVFQGMGGGLLTWLWPFTGSTSFHDGLIFPVNGFEDRNVTWPPPDPDRLSRKDKFTSPARAFMHYQDSLSAQEQVKAFRQRQQHDLKRNRQETASLANDDSPPESSKQLDVQVESDHMSNANSETVHSSQNSWRNNEGDNLNDFGVDEDAEFYDEDEVPISQLLRKRKKVARS